VIRVWMRTLDLHVVVMALIIPVGVVTWSLMIMPAGVVVRTTARGTLSRIGMVRILDLLWMRRLMMPAGVVVRTMLRLIILAGIATWSLMMMPAGVVVRTMLRLIILAGIATWSLMMMPAGVVVRTMLRLIIHRRYLTNHVRQSLDYHTVAVPIVSH
jgi:hypothetical protein